MSLTPQGTDTVSLKLSVRHEIQWHKNNVCCMKTTVNPQRHKSNYINKHTLSPNESVFSPGPSTAFFPNRWHSVFVLPLYLFQTWQLILSNPPLLPSGFHGDSVEAVCLWWLLGRWPITVDGDQLQMKTTCWALVIISVISSISLTCRLACSEIKTIALVER